MSAYAELYQSGMAREHPEDSTGSCSGIQRETGRMGHLVEDLLLLARLDEGLPLGAEPVELVTLGADAVHTAARQSGPTGPSRLEPPGPSRSSAIALRLRQVLDNLLANVRAHTPTGTTTAVSVEPDRGRGHRRGDRRRPRSR